MKTLLSAETLMRNLAMSSLIVPLLLPFSVAAGTESFTGTLAKDDALQPDRNAFSDSYTIRLEEGQITSVEMRSASFDTYLIVRAPSGLTHENDDFEGANTSRVDFVAEESGDWTVVATAYGAGETGAYMVDVDAGAIAEIRVIEGRLVPSDGQSLKGEYLDTYELPLDAGTPVTVYLQSYGFDGYLVVESPTGRFWRNDDFGSVDRSRVGPLTPAQKGVWKVHVTSAMAEEVGGYDLRLTIMPES